MPEGPEIIITSQYLTSKIKKKNIIGFEILGGRYTHQKLKGLELINNTPLTIQSIDSKGKFLWMKMLDKTGKCIYMLNTFGMTGKWSFIKNPSARIMFTIQSKTDLNKTYSLYYIDGRNFGTMEFTSNKNILNKKINKLASDVLKTKMSDDDLSNMIIHYRDTSRKDKNLVKVLMDQEAIVSGIGNYLVAEILYEAKLNPHRSLDDLTEIEINNLAHAIRKIAKEAYYDNNSGYMEQYDAFMKTHTEKIEKGQFPDYHTDIKSVKKFKFKVYQKDLDPLGNKVENDEIVKGRTIHWVKKIQK
jgi:formamidopyrimidine-DNA glycosylase